MKSTPNNKNKYDSSIELAKHLRDKGNIDEAIKEYNRAAEWAVKKESYLLEMQAHNLLASLYWSREDLSETLYQYGKVIGIGRECDIRHTKEYTEAIYHIVVILTRIQPPPPQLFTLAKELVDVRCEMVNDKNDKDFQDYKLILDTLNKVYKRRHRLRKPRKYTFMKIIGVVNE